MGETTKIEWTDETWNPVRGCSRVSPGCDNCYAMRMARRQDVPGGAYEGLTRSDAHEIDWSGDVRLVPELLQRPFRWRKPRHVFVNSMGDLFHRSVPDEFIAAVFGVMAACLQHTFQVLTKRPERAREWFDWAGQDGNGAGIGGSRIAPVGPTGVVVLHDLWPLPNVWLGVTAEDQRRADERIPLLLQCPASVRFVSVEPMLGPVDLSPSDDWLTRTCCRYGGRGCDGPGCMGTAIDWVIVGGESGPGARECSSSWIGRIVNQCDAAGVPVFVKQWGSRPTAEILGGPRARRLKSYKGNDPAEWPEWMRRREWPL